MKFFLICIINYCKVKNYFLLISVLLLLERYRLFWLKRNWVLKKFYISRASLKINYSLLCAANWRWYFSSIMQFNTRLKFMMKAQLWAHFNSLRGLLRRWQCVVWMLRSCFILIRKIFWKYWINFQMISKNFILWRIIIFYLKIRGASAIAALHAILIDIRLQIVHF